MVGGSGIGRWLYRATAISALLGPTVPPALATEIEGTQPFATGQPWVAMSVRREPDGRPLAAGRGIGKRSDLAALLDTGTATIVLDLDAAKAFGIKRATKGTREVVVDDFGVFGRAKFGVSEPLHVTLGPYGSARQDIGYPVTFGPVRLQIGGIGDPLMDGIVGMAAMRNLVAVLDLRPEVFRPGRVRTYVLDPRKDRDRIPKMDRHVMLSYASSARFGHIEPAGAPAPAGAEVPFVGPSPYALADGSKNSKDDAPEVVVTFNGRQSSGSWLFDTGAFVSVISRRQARNLGVIYAERTEGSRSPKLDGVPAGDQFVYAISGVGGERIAAGLFLDALILPTREGDPIIYRKAPVLVHDFTVVAPDVGQESVTIDGMLAMNYFVGSFHMNGAEASPTIDSPYEFVVFDAAAGTLGLRLKPNGAKSAKAEKPGGPVPAALPSAAPPPRSQDSPPAHRHRGAPYRITRRRLRFVRRP